MKKLPEILSIIAALGLGIGLVVRLVQTAAGAVRPAFLDPVFYWRGSMALLTVGIAVVLIQIRNK